MNNEITKPKKQFLNYINVFRGLAILLIVMGHTMQIANPTSLLHIINCEIICGGTALFIFISGFLFQHLSYKFEYKNYLSKKLTNVIAPYIITAVPGLVFCFLCPIAYKNSLAGLNPLLQIPMLLSVGRIHNVPTWFIPMIAMFFLCSWALLKLEKKNILYKLLPILFIITLVFQRGDIEYEHVINLSYIQRYLQYVNYVLLGFVHFFALYVFGMYCSKNKDIIDKFFNLKNLLCILTILTAIVDIWLSYKQIYCNFTISKTFLTMLLLAYLKHYDEEILKRPKLNKALDFIAKYSFGLFFIHWYWLFIFDEIFKLPNVIPVEDTSTVLVILLAFARFLAVFACSTLTLFGIKKLLLKINSNINTRMFLGI